MASFADALFKTLEDLNLQTHESPEARTAMSIINELGRTGLSLGTFGLSELGPEEIPQILTSGRQLRREGRLQNPALDAIEEELGVESTAGKKAATVLDTLASAQRSPVNQAQVRQILLDADKQGRTPTFQVIGDELQADPGRLPYQARTKSIPNAKKNLIGDRDEIAQAFLAANAINEGYGQGNPSPQRTLVAAGGPGRFPGFENDIYKQDTMAQIAQLKAAGEDETAKGLFQDLERKGLLSPVEIAQFNMDTDEGEPMGLAGKAALYGGGALLARALAKRLPFGLGAGYQTLEKKVLGNAGKAAGKLAKAPKG